MVVHVSLSLLLAGLLRFSTPVLAENDSIELCGSYQSYSIPSGVYEYSANAWGNDGSGAQCVTVADNGTAFSATFEWEKHPDDTHAYPNIRLEDNTTFPVPLWNLSSLRISSAWSYAGGDTPRSQIDDESLEGTAINADVAVDMFLDANPDKAQSTTEPKYEIMIWVGLFGDIGPIGYKEADTNKTTYQIGDAVYSLYRGKNDKGQHVYSWVCPYNLTTFDEDFSPLVHYLWHKGHIPKSVYLGTLQFGSEAFHATRNVTFSMNNTGLGVTKGKVVAKLESAGNALQPVFVFNFVGWSLVAALWLLL